MVRRREGISGVVETVRWFKSLLLNLCYAPHVFPLDPLDSPQATDVFLDSGTAGVGIEIMALFGDKAVEKAEVLRRE